MRVNFDVSSGDSYIRLEDADQVERCCPVTGGSQADDVIDYIVSEDEALRARSDSCAVEGTFSG